MVKGGGEKRKYGWNQGKKKKQKKLNNLRGHKGTNFTAMICEPGKETELYVKSENKARDPMKGGGDPREGVD